MRDLRRVIALVVLVGLVLLLLPAGSARSDDDVEALKKRIRELEQNLAGQKKLTFELQAALIGRTRELSTARDERAAARQELADLKQRLEDQQRETERALAAKAKITRGMIELLADVGEAGVPALLGALKTPKTLSAVEVIGVLEGMKAKARTALPQLRELARSDRERDEALAEAAREAVSVIEEAVKAAE